jgi:predicted membrane metal-binding protein
MAPTMLHEVERQPSAKIGSERSFGLVFAAVFLLAALWPLLDRASPRWWSIGVAAAFALCAWFAPRVLAPLNLVWFRFGELLHRIVSPIALGAIFFGVITPFALVMRAFKRDALLLHKRSARPSYWVRREPPGPPPDSFHNQF